MASSWPVSAWAVVSGLSGTLAAHLLRCPFGGEPASEGAEPAQPASLCGQATGLGCDTVLHVMATPVDPLNAMAWCW